MVAIVPEITDWYKSFDLEGLRVSRPSRFLFLCGGAVELSASARAANVRDYLLRVRPARIVQPVVLAEEATEIYRDTSYPDLIEFEEDIARIAGIILIISESPGALAELGAFTSNEIIKPNLRIIMSKAHDDAKSFVRYGPVERLTRHNREFKGVYPWKFHRKTGKLNVSSIKSHYTEIVKFINKNIETTSKSTQFSNLDNHAKLLYVTYWVICLTIAISRNILYAIVKSLINNVSDEEIRKKIYALKIARWINIESYSDKDYIYTLFDFDPFDYSYISKENISKPIRHKTKITAALSEVDAIPKHVKTVATRARVVPK